MRISEDQANRLYEILKLYADGYMEMFKAASFPGIEIKHAAAQKVIEEIEAANAPQRRWQCKRCDYYTKVQPPSGGGSCWDNDKGDIIPHDFVEFVEKVEK